MIFLYILLIDFFLFLKYNKFFMHTQVEEPYATGGGIKRPSSLVKGPGGGWSFTFLR
jgi:hypothetical protein